MRKQLSRIFPPLFLLFVFIAALIPVPAFAVQTPTVISVKPNSIVSGTSTVITVNVENAPTPIDTAQILLDGVEIPGTVIVDGTRLRVTVPADVTVGSHLIQVTINGQTIDGSVRLTVTESAPFERPQLVVVSSRTRGSVSTNDEFRLAVELRNVSSSRAYSAQAAFSSTDLAPLSTGGVVALGDIDAGADKTAQQEFLVTAQLSGQLIVMVDVTVTYYDEAGTSYSDKFTLTVETSGGGSSGVAYPTATPTGVKSSQIVIPSYAVSIDPLQPGEQFTLTMTVQNMGNAKAQRITMIVGGGSGGGGGADGTPQPGGVSGGSGEFTNFAPVGASNVQTLGDLPAGSMVQASQNLIVNVSTNPGAYPMKVTFSYLNERNEVINDEQVITLLVYGLPNVDVSFYRPPDPFFVGQPGALPIQVVNIGKRASVLGNLRITTESGTIENGTGLVGSLDAGGYFTLDSMFIPEQSGTQVLTVTIDYTDDFNQARTITRKLEVEVMEGMEEPIIDPSMPGPNGGGGGGEFPVMTEETALQKVWRFVLGLLGLDSAPPAEGGGEQFPPEMEPVAPEVKPGAGKG